MKIVISAGAGYELGEATDYDDDQFPGLGGQLFGEYQAAVEYIRIFPDGWRRTSGRASYGAFRTRSFIADSES